MELFELMFRVRRLQEEIDYILSPPQRIQRQRTRGWRMPANTVYVGRPTKWGNPFRVGRDGDAQECVEKYREWLQGQTELVDQARQELAGKHLACWCPLDHPCHADVLLEIANHTDE